MTTEHHIDLYKKANVEIAAAKTVEELRAIHDDLKREDLNSAADRAGNLSNAFKQVELRIRRRIGELLGEAQHGGDRRSDEFQVPRVGLEIPKQTASRYRALAEIPEEEFEEALARPQVPSQTQLLAGQERTKRRQTEKSAADRNAIAAAVAPNHDVVLINEDIALLQKHVKKGVVDIIFTAPPPEQSAVRLYSDLEKFAEHSLKPGGLLLTLSVSAHLPDIYQRLEFAHELQYHWQFMYSTPRTSQTIRHRKIQQRHNPLICYSKGEYTGGWHDDLITAPHSTDRQQQREGGIYEILQQFVAPGMTICDPFCNDGITGTVALQLGCSFIGADIDANRIATTKQRIQEWKAKNVAVQTHFDDRGNVMVADQMLVQTR